MTGSLRPTLRILFTTALILIAYIFKAMLVQPPAIDPDHAFNTERAFERLERILGNETPHPVDSDANDAVRARLISEIETLGFSPFVGDEFHCRQFPNGQARCARLQNVGFWVTEPGPNAVMVMSHYDSVPAGPGASDDGAGVSASLEIAAVLKDEPLTRPLLILITDGEEFGLMGANLFANDDPLVKDIGAVVNMEARGVRGLSALIQTSRPNGRDLKTLRRTTRLPAASSLNADIYELLPNDTDMTEFLDLDIDAANLAYAEGERFYHTQKDNLAELDKRALFNIGASGLTATQAFLDQTGEEAESQLLYVDILGLGLTTMPIWFAGTVLAISALIAFLLLINTDARGSALRAGLAPPLALLLGLGLAFGATYLVAEIRPEANFAGAWPMALRTLHASAALFGAMLVYAYVARAASSTKLLASACLWFAIIGAAAFFFVRGAGIVFAPSAIFFAGAALLTLLNRARPALIVTAIGLITFLSLSDLSHQSVPLVILFGGLPLIPLLVLERPGLLLAAFGALLFALIALPLTALGESGLLIENAAPFAFIVALLFVLVIPFHWVGGSLDRHTRRSGLALLGLTMVASFAASVYVPAYSVDAPRHVSVSHIQMPELETPVWSVFGAETLPEAMANVAAFETGSLAPFGGPRQMAPAPAFATTGIDIAYITDTVRGEMRTITLAFTMSDIDRTTLLFRGDTDIHHAAFNGETFGSPDLPVTSIVCAGRACRNGELTFSFPASLAAPTLGIVGNLFGLGPESEPLLAARPDWALPRQSGDQRVFYRETGFDPEQAPTP